MKYIWRLSTLLITVFLFSTLLLANVHTTSAVGQTVTVPAGHQSPNPIWLYWNVVGGSLTCKGTTDYVSSFPNENASFPSSGSTFNKVQLAWTTGVQPATGGMRIDDINVPGTYRFTCTDTMSTAFDYVDVEVTNPCNASQTWDQTTASCKTNVSASFTTPATNKSCTILANNSGCVPTLTWTSSGATSVWLTDCFNSIYGAFGTGAQSSTVWTPYNAGCYLIQHGGTNNSGVLSGGTILTPQEWTSSSCTTGTTWDGSKCRLNVCPNGQYWDVLSSTCKNCDNGGCTGTGGTVLDPIPTTLICINGATDVPFCTPPPVMPVGTFTVSTPNSTHIINGTSATTATNVASNGEIVRFSWPTITNATSCTMNGVSIPVSGGTSDVTATGWPGLSKAFTFTCSNSQHTVSDIITVSYPAAPSGVALSCATDGESATASWVTAGISTYTTTAWEKVGASAATEITDPAIKKTGYTGPTSLTFSIDPKGPLSSPTTSMYTVEIQSQATNGALSAKSSAVRSCARPLPTVSLVPHTKNDATLSGSAYYDEASSTAYLSWTTANHVTSCTLKSNNVTISTTLAASNSNYGLPTGDTKNNLDTQYDLICYNSTGSKTATVHVVVPPVPTPVSMTNCPAPGNQGTVSWTYPSGYTRGFYNIINTAAHASENPLMCGTKSGDICGSNSTLTSYTFPATLNETYTWWVRTEHPTNVNFSDGAGGSFTCIAPDLQAGAVAPGSGIPTTETMTVTTFEASVVNTGSQDTPTSFKSYIQVSDSYNTSTGLGDGPYHNMSYVTIPVLIKNSGNVKYITGSYTFPTAGVYAVRACADQSGQGDPGTITESNENNNCGPWSSITVQSLPRVSLDPSTDQTLYPKTPLTITSTATDADGNLKEHNITVKVNGVEYKNTALSSSEGSVSVTVGTTGTFAQPGLASNSYTAVFTPSHPGTFIISANAAEFIYTGYVTKQITVTVECHNDEWWNLTDCVKPASTIDVTCANGALNPTTCDRCAPTDVFYNGRCINAGICYAEHYNLRPFTCGNGTVDSGEECDGTAGLSNPATQKCTNKCTITCATGASVLYGAPSCGAGIDKVFNSGNTKVTACTNGALQSSAPTCNVCPNGESGVTINGKLICKAPLCGNNSVDTGTTEECDSTAGVTSGKFCTSNCCLVNSQPPLSQVEQLPTYTLSCDNSDLYAIVNSAGTTVQSGAYTAPVTFKPTVNDTYTYKCLYSGNANSKSEQLIRTELPNATSSATGRTTINASPKSISKNSSVTLSWITPFPDNQCSIRATPMITTTTRTCDDSCVAARFRETNRINSELRLGVTDKNDLGISNDARPILTALQTAPSALVPGATKAVGKKTVNLNYSTIFYASCSANPVADPNASRVKISVVGDSEN